MTPAGLLHVLADGRIHSGEALAREFGVTRAAVWKQVGKLAAWGLRVEAMPGEGYRLTQPIDLIDSRVLRAHLAPPTVACLARLDVFMEIESTNRHLLAERPPPGKLNVCLAEFQTAGRGRRGRSWSAPLGCGICLSVGWHFVDMPADVAALTLAIGVVARRVVRRVTGVEIELKWPNDLVWAERKLGGVLVELAAEAQGGSHVVAGIGLNVALPPDLLPSLSDWPRGAVDLATALGEPPPRLPIVAALVDALAVLFAEYPVTGFAAYRSDWRDGDYLRGRAVRLDEAAGPVYGTALGIEADGALVIETATGRRRVVAGDVSVRSRA